jgi:hypothetical protein
VTQITVSVSDTLARIIKKKNLDETFIQSGFKEAVRSRLSLEKQNLIEAKAQMKSFEKKYKCDFQTFEKTKLKKNDSIEVHEDYNDWYFWFETYKQTAERIKSFEEIGGKI